MLWTITKKEILDALVSTKFVATFLLCAVLILLSMYIGIENYRGELREYHAAVALNRKNLENQPTYSHLATFGTKINKPPQALSILVTGIQPAVGRQATVNFTGDPTLAESEYDSNPISSLFGDFDLTMIVKIVLSLFALLISYDAISGEKERGALRMIISNPLPRSTVILGKFIGGLVSLLVPLSVPLLTGFILLTVYPDVSLSGEDWARIGLIGGLFLLYISVYFTLGFLISTLTGRPSNSLFVLLFIWVASVFVIPKAAVMVTKKFHPIPSIHEITAQKDAALREIQGSVQREQLKMLQARPAKITPEWNEKWRELNNRLVEDVPAQISARNVEIERDFQAKRHAQQAIAFNLSRISPASALTYGAMRLGKTGPDENERFLNSVKAYRPVFTKWINTRNTSATMAQKPDIESMPRHTFEPENLRNSLRQALPDFAILAFMILAVFAGAFVSFLRYDVR
jgi:ABC-type transport system involved in multi-copper enzyme maturation permease subunit